MITDDFVPALEEMADREGLEMVVQALAEHAQRNADGNRAIPNRLDVALFWQRDADILRTCAMKLRNGGRP